MSLPVVTIWASQDSSRLRYVLDWLLVERLGLNYQLTHDEATVGSAEYSIAYGFLENTASIHAVSLLWETGVHRQDIPVQEWKGLYTLFYDPTSPCDIQFDMLAGIFYLLTRYEEYLANRNERDGHIRYRAEASIVYEVLERPVVDEWVEAFRLFLEQVWSISIPQKPFSFQPTYDIDIAWSYRFKGLRRTIGGLLKDMLGMHWGSVAERVQVLRGTKADPFDSFVWIMTQHIEREVLPIYFILAALQTSRYDKNISPKHSRMASLIKGLSVSGIVGLHPSYESCFSNPKRLGAEMAELESIAGAAITQTRQHYIRLQFPFTYDILLGNGLTDDYSMGYSTHFGFRAGTSASFPWYRLPIDPELSVNTEEQTSLRVHPFAFMDTTGHYDLGVSAVESFDHLRQMTAKLQACGGTLITILHNFSLGTDPEWKGWRKEYERFLHDIKTAGNSARS